MKLADCKNISWNWIWLALFTVGFGIFFMVTPKCFDDLWYSQSLKDWYIAQNEYNPNNGGNIYKYGIPWEAIVETIHSHYSGDNVRLGNMLAPFALLFPKWFGSLFTLISMIFAVIGSFKLANIVINKSWLVGIGLALWILTPIWYESMGCLVFQYNYVIPSALSLWFIYMIRKQPKGTFYFIFFILLSIVTALWHEGFTMPLCVGLVTLLIFYSKSRNKWVIISALIMMAGLIWHFAGTSTMSKATHGFYGFKPQRLIHSLWYHRAMWIMFVVLFYYIIKEGIRNFYKDSFLIFLFITIMASFGITYIIESNRAAWLADILSIVMILYILRILDKRTLGYKGWRGWIAGILLICAGFELGAADVHTIRFAQEYPYLIKNAVQNPEKTQFSKVVDYPWKSLPFLQMVCAYEFMWPRFNDSNYWLLDKKYENNNLITLKIVPEGLRYFTPDEATPLKGDLGFMKYGKYLVAPTDWDECFWIVHTNIDYGWFKAKNRVVSCTPFISEADGKRYVYAYPLFNLTEYEIGDVKGVSLGDPIEGGSSLIKHLNDAM